MEVMHSPQTLLSMRPQIGCAGAVSMQIQGRRMAMRRLE
jgi:hypothetical protein